MPLCCPTPSEVCSNPPSSLKFKTVLWPAGDLPPQAFPEAVLWSEFTVTGCRLICPLSYTSQSQMERFHSNLQEVVNVRPEALKFQNFSKAKQSCESPAGPLMWLEKLASEGTLSKGRDSRVLCCFLKSMSLVSPEGCWPVSLSRQRSL